MYLLGVLVLVLGVLVSIALHEVGHLVPAKLFGVKCTQYMIGFGPTLWSRRVGETEYGVKAVPLGGYVRMLGMFPPKADGSVRPDSAGRWSTLAERAREDARREIGPDDADRLFYQRSVPKRLVIMLGGPVMNLVLAFVFLGVVVTAIGVPQTVPKVWSVSSCVLPAGAAADRACTPADPVAPAARAGLRQGDEIVTFDGQPVATWTQVQDRIRQNRGTPVRLGIVRAGQRLTVTVTPTVAEREQLDANRQPLVGADGKKVYARVGFLGVLPVRETVRQSPAEVPALVGEAVRQTAGVVLVIPAKIVGVVQSVVTGSERDVNGPISLVGVGRVAGEAASADGPAGGQPVGAAERVGGLLGLVASLNVALFVFNLIPLLPLDGGHVAGALWEAARRRVARLRRRPDPGPVDIARALPLAYGVASLLIGMSVILIYADIVNPVRV